MSLLVDWQIRNFTLQYKMLEPFSEAIQGDGVISYGLTHAGYDLRLGRSVLIFKDTYCEIVDPKKFKKDPSYMNRIFDKIEDIKDHEPVLVPARGYILGYTMEYIRMPPGLSGTCVGKSTLARCGIVINTTPLEPNWHGHLTLEIVNASPCPVKIYVGEGIAQLRFEKLHDMPETDYESKCGKYQGQKAEPVAARTKE
jgi:dCTP deaminase